MQLDFSMISRKYGILEEDKTAFSVVISMEGWGLRMCKQFLVDHYTTRKRSITYYRKLQCRVCLSFPEDVLLA